MRVSEQLPQPDAERKAVPPAARDHRYRKADTNRKIPLDQGPKAAYEGIE